MAFSDMKDDSRKMIVSTVKTIIVFPCFAASVAHFREYRASQALEVFCLRSISVELHIVSGSFQQQRFTTRFVLDFLDIVFHSPVNRVFSYFAYRVSEIY